MENVKSHLVSLRTLCHCEEADVRRLTKQSNPGFTLTEVLVAISLFSIVATIVSGLYIQSFRESAFANSRNQIYDDARFILSRIGDEIRDGMVDYDEYYNQKVVIPALGSPGIRGVSGDQHKNYGQNFGRYYSAFFHPGEDKAMGFDCNDASETDAIGNQTRTDKRNKKKCTPKRRTIDRNTGQNPFEGKYEETDSVNKPGADENAFCGVISYEIDGNVSKPSCPNNQYTQDELYLISKDGFQKTILALEKTYDGSTNALSMLRLKGFDTNADGLADSFVCAPGFTCRGGDDVSGISKIATATEIASGIEETAECGPLVNGSVQNIPAELSRRSDANGAREDLLESGADLTCDTADQDFSKDFIPISPLRVNITKLKFIISPLENPHYAFAENNIEQPRVTIILTVAPRAGGATQEDEAVTLVETVSTRTITPIPSPISVE